MAVGNLAIIDKAENVIASLISLQETKVEEEDPMRYLLLQAWGRLCKCLGADFIPYLSVAMPIVLKSATLKNYLSVFDNSDDSDDERLLQAAVNGFSSFFPDYQERIARHEAAYFLVSYLIGLPILRYSLDIGKEHVNLIDGRLEKLIYSGQLGSKELDRPKLFVARVITVRSYQLDALGLYKNSKTYIGNS